MEVLPIAAVVEEAAGLPKEKDLEEVVMRNVEELVHPTRSPRDSPATLKLTAW